RRRVAGEMRTRNQPWSTRKVGRARLGLRVAGPPAAQDWLPSGDVVDDQVREVRGGVDVVQPIEVHVPQRDTPELQLVVEQCRRIVGIRPAGDWRVSTAWDRG